MQGQPTSYPSIWAIEPIQRTAAEERQRKMERAQYQYERLRDSVYRLSDSLLYSADPYVFAEQAVEEFPYSTAYDLVDTIERVMVKSVPRRLISRAVTEVQREYQKKYDHFQGCPGADQCCLVCREALSSCYHTNICGEEETMPYEAMVLYALTGDEDVLF